jgi:hypothetical protein
MTFTYNSNPTGRTIDAVRLEVGDYLDNQHELEDEEILYAFGVEGSVVKAAARCCEILAAKFAKKEGFRGGTIQTEKTTISGKYRQQARLLRARGITSAAFIMPALSQTDKDNNTTNTDIPQPSFYRGMHKNPDTDVDSDQDLSITGNT